MTNNENQLLDGLKTRYYAGYVIGYQGLAMQKLLESNYYETVCYLVDAIDLFWECACSACSDNELLDLIKETRHDAKQALMFTMTEKDEHPAECAAACKDIALRVSRLLDEHTTVLFDYCTAQ